MKRPLAVPKSGMRSAARIRDPDATEQRLLRQRAKEARQFMLGLRWCRAIHKQWLAGGFSHVAVFLFEIDNAQSPQDKELWVVVGDLPPAYLVIDRSPNFKDALLAYIYEMRRWVKAVKGGRSTARCIPVNVKPTMEHAAMLQSRLDFIEKKYVPSLARENRT